MLNTLSQNFTAQIYMNKLLTRELVLSFWRWRGRHILKGLRQSDWNNLFLSNWVMNESIH